MVSGESPDAEVEDWLDGEKNDQVFQPKSKSIFKIDVQEKTIEEKSLSMSTEFLLEKIPEVLRSSRKSGRKSSRLGQISERNITKKIHKDDPSKNTNLDSSNLYWKKNPSNMDQSIGANGQVIDRVRSTLNGLYEDKLIKNKMSLRERAEKLMRNSRGSSAKQRIDEKREKLGEISGKKKLRVAEKLIENSFVRNLESKLSKVENELDCVNATQTQESGNKNPMASTNGRLSQRGVDIKGSSRWSKLNFMTRKASVGARDGLTGIDQAKNGKFDNTPNKNSRIEDYEFVGKTLGQGGSAVVRMAYYQKSREKYAIKSFNRLTMSSTSRLKQIKHEYDTLFGLEHENIIKYYNYFENVRHIHIVMELAGTMNLKEFIEKRNSTGKPLTKTEIIYIWRQVL